jgi:phosphate transport system substrate-binding protein
MPEYFAYGNLRAAQPENASLVVCSTTSVAFKNIIYGYADIAFLMGISSIQRESLEGTGLTLVLTPIGHEAFIFFVNSQNPVTNLTTEDVRRIYSGQILNWNEIDGSDNGGNNKIMAYQRPDESGSQTMLKQIMGSTPPVPAPQNEIFNTMLGMYQRVADYKNYRNSLGYSFRYYIRDMIGENKVKVLSINGIPPTPLNIADDVYPYTHELYAVTVMKNGRYLNPKRSQNIDNLLKWFTSTQGQYLVEATGYQSIVHPSRKSG